MYPFQIDIHQEGRQVICTQTKKTPIQVIKI